MAYSVKWYGPKVIDSIKAMAEKRMEAATVVVANRAKQLISTPYPPPSRPGEPPHRRTGRLRASVAREVTWDESTVIGRVGSNVKYAKWLELGTSRMAARPWLRRALIETRNAIAKIIGE